RPCRTRQKPMSVLPLTKRMQMPIMTQQPMRRLLTASTQLKKPRTLPPRLLPRFATTILISRLAKLLSKSKAFSKHESAGDDDERSSLALLRFDIPDTLAQMGCTYRAP